MEKLLKIDQVSELLQISKSLVYKWVHYDYIPHYKVGRLVRFNESEINKWLKRRLKKGRNQIRIETYLTH